MKSHKIFFLGVLVFVSIFTIASFTLATGVSVNVTATPSSIPYNGISNIQWSSTGATSCTTPGWGGATSGNHDTQQLQVNSTYSISCRTGGCVSISGSQYNTICAMKSSPTGCGSVMTNTNPPEPACEWDGDYGSDTATVTVAPPVFSVNVTAGQSQVNPGGSTTIGWTSILADSCTLSGGGITGSGTSNSGVSTGPLNTTTTYTVTCQRNVSSGTCNSDWPEMECYASNIPPANDYGTCQDFCGTQQHNSANACNNALASPGGDDPLQKVCIWTQGNSQTTYVTGTVTVNVKTTQAYFNEDPSVTSVAVDSGTQVRLYWSNTGFTNGKCDVYKDGTIPSNGAGLSTNYHYYKTYTNPPEHQFNYVVKCYEATAPVTLYPSNPVAVTVNAPAVVKPDLTASGLTPLAAVVGVPKTFHATITNNGDADTDYQGTRTFINLFQTATGFDDAFNPINLIDYSAGPMDTLPGGGETNIASRSITFSSVGNYWMRACADKSSAANLGTIAESHEDNNCISPWVPITVVSDAKPDLTPSFPVPSTSAPIVAGVPVTFSSIITNKGTADTNYKGVNTFTNLFQTATGFNADDNTPIGLEDHPVPGMTNISDGGTKTTSHSVTFPDNGTYYIRACADKSSQNDVNGVIVESLENNNCSDPWTQVVVGTPDQADLTADMVTPSSAIVGVNTTFSATITNIGTVSTGGSFHNFAQISADQTTFLDLPASLMTTLVAGQSKIMSMTHKFTSAGTYYARVCANKINRNTFDSIVESNYNNNCSPRLTVITVTDPNSTMSVDLSANPMFMFYPPDDTTTLTWTVTGTPDTCNATGDWSGAKDESNGSHTESIPNLNGVPPSPHTYTFNITCKKTGVANAFASVSVNVLEKGQQVDAQCGLTHFDCLLGTYDGNGNNDGTNWNWMCQGANGGADAYCSESVGGSECANPLYTNYPKCDACVNGEAYPKCIAVGDSCMNPLYAPPSCDTCINGLAYPSCTIGGGGTGVDLCPNQPGIQTNLPCKKVPGYIER